MSSTKGHVTAGDLMRNRGWLTRQRMLMGVGGIVVVALVVLLGLGLIPKSDEQKYDADLALMRRVVLAHHTGYAAVKPSAPVTIIASGQDSDFHHYPTFAVLNKGAFGALKEEEAGSEQITTLGDFGTNPVGDGANQAGDPIWEDVDGGGRNASADKLFYHDASPPPTVDHWNTTRVMVDDTAYVVDSRDWFINFQRLVEKGYLQEVPESASPDNHTSGTGSYTWYVDSNGKVKTLLYSSPVPSSTGFQGVYP